ncbi:uncharacterized protein LOC126804765 [Argentina anserina]|uniref:uncharacterized protein LOC126804765 n=1 Tax=Argentina anserina TaxID=57926 RepID=UPI002176590D|nr:uncharacterized protein LOC126804765 [Potentilla anserina]
MKNSPVNNNMSVQKEDIPEEQHPQQQQKQPQQPQQQDQRVFFQLTGHKECFKTGTRANTILKKATGNEESCLRELMDDSLSKFVPRLIGTVDVNGQRYLEMEDLLFNFENASVMDVKMGSRTYREEELNIAAREEKLRRDMYEKMIEIDKSEPTDQERQLKAITKPRYMVWRETISSTSSLGFRIEGMRFEDGSIDKGFKTMKNEQQIEQAIARYARLDRIKLKYLKRLHDLREALMKSKFFSTHEVIGSSLLFIHNDTDANIWLIDFAKTDTLPANTMVTHRKKWELGNHEDGYLVGIENLIRIFEQLISRTNDLRATESAATLEGQQQQQQQQQQQPPPPISQGRRPIKPQMSRLTCLAYGR